MQVLANEIKPKLAEFTANFYSHFWRESSWKQYNPDHTNQCYTSKCHIFLQWLNIQDYISGNNSTRATGLMTAMGWILQDVFWFVIKSRELGSALKGSSAKVYSVCGKSTSEASTYNHNCFKALRIEMTVENRKRNPSSHMKIFQLPFCKDGWFDYSLFQNVCANVCTSASC